VITGDITTSTTWHRDTTYTLNGFIHVANGATLTIEAGTTIKGDFNTSVRRSSSCGAKIMAIGTAALPIVFTSSQPVGQRKPGDWGGLILIGNGVLSRTGVTISLEGSGTDVGTAPGTNYDVTYSGGTVNTDNSGEFALRPRGVRRLRADVERRTQFLLVRGGRQWNQAFVPAGHGRP
jgi:hypothetical protein